MIMGDYTEDESLIWDDETIVDDDYYDELTEEYCE